jgi:iron complex outermembrane receptor protein
VDQRFGDDRLRVTLYGGNREVIQYQAFTKGLPGAAHPFRRRGRLRPRLLRLRRQLAAWCARSAAAPCAPPSAWKPASRKTTARASRTSSATTFGVKGALRRDEEDDVRNLDPYLQMEWEWASGCSPAACATAA